MKSRRAAPWLLSRAAFLLLYTASAQARFLQTDPVGYQDDLNAYLYGHDDPANNTDPSGKSGQGTLSDDAWKKVADPSQQQTIAAVNAALVRLANLKKAEKALADGKIKSLSQADAATKTAMEKSFGVSDEISIDLATNMLNHVDIALADGGANYNYNFSTLAQTTEAVKRSTHPNADPRKVYGYANKYTPVVNLTGAYFNDISEYQSTELHETTHLFGTEDKYYGRQDIERATGRGENLINNADSFSLFVLGH